MEKLKKLGFETLEGLEERDIDQLAEAGEITKVEALQLNQELRKVAKTKEKYPVPDLAANAPLNASDLYQFGRLELPELPSAGSSSGEPPNISGLTAAEWMCISVNCNLCRGVKFQDPLKASGESLLIPPNSSLLPLFTPSQESEMFHYEVTSSNSFDKTLMMAETSAFAKVQTPFVSASMDFKQSNEKQYFEEGEKHMTITKYTSPVGDFVLGIDGPIVVDKPRDEISVPINVNPDFVDDARKLLDAVKQSPPAGKWGCMQPLLANLHEKWGEVIPARVTVGVGLYKTEVRETKFRQSKEEAKLEMRASIGGGYGGYGGSAGAGRQTNQGEETGTGAAKGWSQWLSIAGNTGNDPAAIAKYRHLPNSWRCVHATNYVSVFDLLPRALRDEMKRLESCVPAPAPALPAPAPAQVVEDPLSSGNNVFLTCKTGIGMNKSLRYPTSRKHSPFGFMGEVKSAMQIKLWDGSDRVIKHGDFVRIVTVETPYSVYKCLYVADAGSCYYDAETDNDKQKWQILKPGARHDYQIRKEDEVHFKNAYFPDTWLQSYSNFPESTWLQSYIDWDFWAIGSTEAHLWKIETS